MGKYEKISSSENFSFQIDSNLSGSLQDALSKLKTKSAFNKTTTVKDVGGVKGLSFITTGSVNNKFEFNSMTKVQYEKKFGDGKIKTGARFANGKVTLDFMVESSNGFGFGLEANATIDPRELKKNGVYLVAAAPVLGMQIVFKYNPVTKDVVVIIRKPMDPGNDEDKKGAAECGCSSPILITVDIKVEPIVNYNYNYNQQQVENGNVVVEVIEAIEDGVVEVGKEIGNVAVAIGEGIADGIANLFKPKERREQGNYNYN